MKSKVVRVHDHHNGALRVLLNNLESVWCAAITLAEHRLLVHSFGEFHH